MGRYRTPLPGMLAAAVEAALNRALSLDPQGGQHLAGLDGKTLCLELKGLGIELHLAGDGERLEVRAESSTTPETTISGTPAALLAMAVPDWRAAGSGVQITGDAGAARTLEKLLRQLDPDWEALLVEHFGPVAGHQLWRMLADSFQGGRRVAATAADQTARFLREESGLLVTHEEMTEFTEQVDELRESLDRIETHLRRRGRP